MRRKSALAEVHRRVVIAGRELARPVGIGWVICESRNAEVLRFRDDDFRRHAPDINSVVNLPNERRLKLLRRHSKATCRVRTHHQIAILDESSAFVGIELPLAESESFLPSEVS